MAINGSIQEGLKQLPLETMAYDINDLSTADQTIDYSELIEEDVFLGDTPFEVIIECLEEQFNDYMNIEDPINYVDIFYDQWRASHRAIQSDEEIWVQEKMEILDRLYEKFMDKISELFKIRLTITIADLDESSLSVNDEDDKEYYIRKLYEFFILNACNNFKTVITKDINAKMGDTSSMNDTEYFETIQNMLLDYYSLLKTITPTQFLDYIGDQEMSEMFEEGVVSGNFLRKYTPKLYKNEEVRVEIISNITMIQHFKEDVLLNRNA